MGNVSSNKQITDDKLNNSSFERPALLNLIDKEGGGSLVDLMKKAQSTKNYYEIDSFIKKEVVHFLYNHGEGKQVPIKRLIEKRKNAKDNIVICDVQSEKETQLHCLRQRYVCFDVDKRGFAGETLLHLCFVNGSYTHINLAKQLIKVFPNQIHDIYLGNDYYGENVLHMAIVNEDPQMLKLLVSAGANIHERCVGHFFFPDDQKNKLVVTTQSEIPKVPKATNYQGLSYFGEYPLSFAATLSQEECVRILIAHGADADKQDSNGNTVLHLLVINNNFEMFKIVFDSITNIRLKNNQGYSALTLAAQLCRKEIFFFILEKLRTIYWTYANISCASYPLADVDSLADDGTIDTHSCLYLILNKNTEEHLELLNGFLTDLLHKKWTSFVRFRFFIEFFLFALFYVITCVTIYMKRGYYDYLKSTNCTLKEEANILAEECHCAYLNPTDSFHYVRTILEIIVVLYTILFILIILNELYIQKWRLFLKTLSSNPTKILFISALLLIDIIIPLRLSCNTDGEDILVVVIIILLSLYSLYFGRGFRIVSTFVYSMHQIVEFNMIRFGIIYSIFLIGFSQMFYLIILYLHKELLDEEGHIKKNFDTPFQSLLDTFILTLGLVVAEFQEIRGFTSYKIIGEVFFVVYLVLGTLLLINILIAMMDHTQAITNERPTEWIRQWGLHVLAVEQNINIKERMKQQKLYLNILSNGEKGFTVRWQQNNEEREGAKLDRELFRRNIQHVETNIQP